jgi:hypothetical protein
MPGKASIPVEPRAISDPVNVTQQARVSSLVDGQAAGTHQLETKSFLMVWDSSAGNWRFLRSDASGNLLVNVAAGGSSAGAAVTLLPLGARAASGSNIVTGLGNYTEAVIVFRVTGIIGDGTQVLRMFIDRSPDQGTVFDTIVRFADVTTATGDFVVSLNSKGSSGEVPRAVDTNPAAPTLRNVPFGDRLRVRWEIAGGGASVSFTMSMQGWFK